MLALMPGVTDVNPRTPRYLPVSQRQRKLVLFICRRLSRRSKVVSPTRHLARTPLLSMLKVHCALELRHRPWTLLKPTSRQVLSMLRARAKLTPNHINFVLPTRLSTDPLPPRSVTRTRLRSFPGARLSRTLTEPSRPPVLATTLIVGPP